MLTLILNARYFGSVSAALIGGCVLGAVLNVSIGMVKKICLSNV